MTRVAGVVLAAGSGSRMGTPKAELEVGGERLVDRAVAVLRAAGCDPVIAVTRPGVAAVGAVSVVNDDPDRGLRSSLDVALTAVTGGTGAGATTAGPPDAIAVLLVDTPGIPAGAVAATIAAWRPGRIAVATYDGHRGHPIVMAPDQWREAVARAGPDEGARALLRAEPGSVDEVSVDGDPVDLDTPGDLAAWTDTLG